MNDLCFPLLSGNAAGVRIIFGMESENLMTNREHESYQNLNYNQSLHLPFGRNVNIRHKRLIKLRNFTVVKNRFKKHKKNLLSSKKCTYKKFWTISKLKIITTRNIFLPILLMLLLF